MASSGGGVKAMRRSHTDQRGATTIEYAFIIAVVILVMLVGLRQLGDKSTSQINNVATQVKNHM